MSDREKKLEGRITELEEQLRKVQEQLERERNKTEVLYLVRNRTGNKPQYQHLTIKENALRHLRQGVKIYEIDFTNNTFTLIAGPEVPKKKGKKADAKNPGFNWQRFDGRVE